MRARDVVLTPMDVRGRTFDWGARTYVMGVINATPDSFSGDGLHGDLSAIAARACAFAAAGCDIIDVGGESTRPNHTPVSESEEMARVLPAVQAVREAVELPISIDTFKPAVAAAAVEAGADIVNCVWGAPAAIIDVAARSGAPLVVMHNQESAEYGGDVVDAVIGWLENAARNARAGGVRHVIVDPGIGFGKTADHNVAILARLGEFVQRLPYPLLVGTSRKSFIGKITGLPPDRRAFGTAATIALSIANGADVVRIHDVEDLAAAVDVADAICRLGAARNPRGAAQPV